MPRLPSSTPPRRCRCPMPVAYDTAYHLDAGDRLRVVVYGQEGLTNTYAIDAGGSITMPLIGAVPARGRTPARSRRRHHRQAAQRFHPRAVGGGGDRGLPAVLHPRRSRSPRPISLRAQHDRSKARWRLPAASRRAPAATASRSPIPMHRDRCGPWCRSAPRSAPAIPCWSANAGSRIRPGHFQRPYRIGTAFKPPSGHVNGPGKSRPSRAPVSFVHPSIKSRERTR